MDIVPLQGYSLVIEVLLPPASSSCMVRGDVSILFR